MLGAACSDSKLVIRSVAAAEVYMWAVLSPEHPFTFPVALGITAVVLQVSK